MHRKLPSIPYITLFFFLAFLGNGSLNASENVCVECHEKLAKPLREPVQKWFQSVHKEAGITCVDCHGGDPTSAKTAMEKSKGFQGVPIKEDIPLLCGGCHSDAKRMRKFNLRTDQLSAYKTRRHGQLLFEQEDENVATCIDCHNAHDVLSKNNPASPVYILNRSGTSLQGTSF